MKNKLFITLTAMLLTLSAFASEAKKGYVVVTDYFSAHAGKDVSDAIQQIIDANPNRTIYFPDGVYILSKPIVTPAEPTKSVALELSNYAILQASEGWNHDEALVRLGGKDEANNIYLPGSNYYLQGGIIDGRGVAKGISIDGGRETVIRDTSIKNVLVGIHIKRGANNGSSDCDIAGVNIVGNNSPESVGVLVEGFDNTFTNMRIASVQVGFQLRSQANMLRNIHPLFIHHEANPNYESSCGFLDEAGCNWYDFCYSDEFATAFRITQSGSHYNNCFAFWYSTRGPKHVVFKCDKRFDSGVMNLHAGHRKENATTVNKVLEVGEEGGMGHFAYLHVDAPTVLTDHSHEGYLK